MKITNKTLEQLRTRISVGDNCTVTRSEFVEQDNGRPVKKTVELKGIISSMNDNFFYVELKVGENRCPNNHVTVITSYKYIDLLLKKSVVKVDKLRFRTDI